MKLFPLIFFLIFAMPTMAQEDVYVYFVCDTKEKAYEVVIDQRPLDNLPDGCRRIMDRGTSKVMIIEVLDGIEMMDHMRIFIGEVANDYIHGYSAGPLELKLF